MAATGSNTVVTDAAFVPDTHVLSLADLREGRTPGGALYPDVRLYRSPHIAWAPLTFVLPMLGAGQAAYEEYVAWLARAGCARPAPPRRGPGDAARCSGGSPPTSTRRSCCCGASRRPRRRRQPPSLELRARAMRDYSRSAQLILDAIDAIVAAEGTASFSADSALQRTWRDVHFAASHASLGAQSNFAHWGRTRARASSARPTSRSSELASAGHPTLEGFDPFAPGYLQDPQAALQDALRETPVFHHEPLRHASSSCATPTCAAC